MTRKFAHDKEFVRGHRAHDKEIVRGQSVHDKEIVIGQGAHDKEIERGQRAHDKKICLCYTSSSTRDSQTSRMPEPARNK